MLKNQLKALMTAYNGLCEPMNRFEAALDEIERYLDDSYKNDLAHNCVNCKMFNESMGEICTLAATPCRPPAWVIVKGCDAFVHKDYDTADAKEYEQLAREKRLLTTLDDTVPF